MSESNAHELERFLKQHPDIDRFDLLLPDINGILRGVRAAHEDMPRIFKTGAFMSASTMLLNSRGELPGGLTIGLRDGDPDFTCRPVPGSLSAMPWTRRPMGQCLLQMFNDDGTPYYYDSRYVLQRVVEKFTELGLTPVVALELEFYLLKNGDGPSPEPLMSRIPGTGLKQRSSQLHSLDDLHEIDAFLTDVETAAVAQNVPTGNFMSEGSPGQYEINLDHVNDAVLAADHALLLKRLIRGVAHSHNMAATFMAKPFAELDGSGMHMHISLLNQHGQNVFAGWPPDNAPDAFAPELRHAIGGIIEVFPETQAILAPNANSWRRFKPDSFVSTRASWGTNHRQVALRIPPSDDANVRFEHRTAGADCNPYLALAAVLASVHHGITQQVKPPAMVAEGQVLEIAEHSTRHWQSALARFESARVLPAYLGEAFCQTYATCRQLEAIEYYAQVPDLDYAWYLGSI